MKKLIALFIVLTAVSSAVFAQGRDSRDLLKEGTFPVGMEGPATDMYGNIYAVNFARKGTIGKVNFLRKAKLFVELPEGSTGNGIRFGVDGYMYVADYTGHNILKIDRRKRTIEVFCHEPLMNQPNDLAISSKSGIIYASDPNWKDSTGKLWMITPDGKSHLLEDNMGTTNGIEVSPNGKKLYVNESIQRNVWVYDIKSDGTVSNKRLLHSFTDFGMDGMRCDPYGNLYITRHGKGTVVKLSPKGRLKREFVLKGKLATNLTLSADNNEIYVTLADRGCFEVITINSDF